MTTFDVVGDDVLRVEHIARRFGAVVALRDVDRSTASTRTSRSSTSSTSGRTMFLHREALHRPIPFLARRRMRREARIALDAIGVHIPSLDTRVGHLSGGQRQAIAVARTVNSDADIILLDEPLAAMGAKEGTLILDVDVIARLREQARVSLILIAHNYTRVLESCDRINLLADGRIVLDKSTADTSVEELTHIIVEEYRHARELRDRQLVA